MSPSIRSALDLGFPLQFMLTKKSYTSGFAKSNKFRSKLVMLQKDGNKILCTYINKGKKYPYNSIKRGPVIGYRSK